MAPALDQEPDIKPTKSEAQDLDQLLNSTVSQDDVERGIQEAEDHANRDGPEYTGSGGAPGKKRGWFYRQRKKLLVGGIAASLLGYGSFFFLVPPIQFVQLGEILGKSDRNNQSSIAKRINDFMGRRRYIRSSRIGETRVGHFGSKRVAIWEQKAAEVGWKLDTSKEQVGRYTLVVDPDLDPKIPKAAIEAQRQFIEARLNEAGIEVERVYKDPGNPRGILVDVDSTKVRNARQIPDFMQERIGRESTKLGRFADWIGRRNMKKFMGLDSLLHPVKNLESKLTRKADRAIDNFFENRRQARLERAGENKSSRVSTKLKGIFSDTKGRISDAISSHRLAIDSVLFIAGAACAFRGVADDIALLNYAGIVGPSAIESTSRQSLGDQVKSGQDISIGQLGDEAETFIDDNGMTIWDGKALNALASDSSGKGEEIDLDYQQAFAGDTTGDNIRETLDKYGATEYLCSPGGLIAQFVANVAVLVFTGPPGYTAKAAQFSRSTVGTMAVFNLIHSFLVKELREDAIKSFAGPQGGNLLAYGARQAANIGARSMGGVAIPNTETVTLLDSAQEIYDQEFQQKSLWAQLFDIKDFRSASGRVVAKIGSNPVQNVAESAFALVNPQNILGSMASIVNPKTVAQTDDYNWEFPIYGIPDSILDDPNYNDPYFNAEKASDIFGGTLGSSYIDKARKCFGVDIKKDSDGRWDSTAVEDVNTAERAYTEANCSDLSDESWIRTSLFIFDTAVISEVECYEGDEAMCKKFGIGSAQSSSNVTGLECPPNLEGPDESKFGYYRMPDPANDEYIVSASASRRYGQKELVCVIYTVSKAFNAKYPDSKVKVGDLNAGDPHATHKWGIAVDINSKFSPVVAGDHTGPGYSTEATIEFGKMFVDTGLIKNIWWCEPNDGSTQAIKDYAAQVGKPLEQIKCIEGHDNHFHIDLNIPPGPTYAPK